MDWFSRGLLGSFIVIFFWLFLPVQLAHAETIFSDSFELDPALNGWQEDIVRIPHPQFPNTATGFIHT